MRTYGLELEVVGVTVDSAARALNAAGVTCANTGYTHTVIEDWKSVPDGSVRGAELVSPILTSDRLNEVTKVCSSLKAAGGRVNTSTGLHVHIGAAGLTPATIATFVRNWYAIHHATGALVAQSRLNNRYCRALGRSEAEHIAARGSSGDRYQSLNLAALTKYGTLEIRLHQGSLNPVKILAWVQYLEALVQVAEAGIELSNSADIEGLEELRTWLYPGHRDAAEAQVLLRWLEAKGFLKANASNWLQVRAGMLNA